MTSTMLHTARDGNPDGIPHIVLHDRYLFLADARKLAERKVPTDALAISVQAPRLQTIGGVGQSYGYYWYVGPRDKAEMTSLGDTLFHIEKLLLDVTVDGRKAVFVGEGEGATVALLSAMTWPEKVERVIAIDASLPANFDRIPIEWPDLNGLEVVLSGTPPDEATLGQLTSRGAHISRVADAA